MSDIKKLVNNFSSSAIGNIAGQAINFFTLIYLPRVLGPDGYGIFSFAQSYTMYFVLMADLGLSLYCIREVNQANEIEKCKIIDKIFTLKLCLSVISTLIFSVTCIIIPMSYLERKTVLFMGISILATGITIDYIFNSLNNMKYIGISIAIKNIVFFILSILYIKNIKQTYFVSIFYSFGVLFSAIFLMIIFKKIYFKINLIKLKFKDINLIKMALPLAVSLFMVQINNNFDIIYISFTRTQDEVGYYSAPYKIINFLIAILCIYFNAAYPTIAKLIKKDKLKLNDYISKFYLIGITFVTPIVFGGIVLNKQIITLLFGESYVKSEFILVLLLPLILIRMITSTYGSVLIMGDGAKDFSKCVFIGATINVILNVILVPYYGSIGAALATLICEVVQGVYLFKYFRKYCDSKFIKSTLLATISSIFMASILNIIYYKFNLFINILIGASIYFIIFVIMYSLMYVNVISNIFKKVK